MNELSAFDHRKLGEQLELFFFDESAPGIPYWLPHGVLVKNLLFNFWREYHQKIGYQEVASPLLNKEQLWVKSGHLEHYKENMFRFDVGEEKESWYLKPMNCANAMVFFGHRPRSYRELPLRLSDCDALHRNEASGALLGLLRARCFCQDDSHNFVSEEQILAEIHAVLEILKDFYRAFGLLQNVHLYLSSRPEGFMGEARDWDKAEAALLKSLEESGIPFGHKQGDGAFYGPKIDIHLKDSLEREWQCGTIQLDYNIPQRFNLSYIDSKGEKQRPVVIHRAIYGSVERFIGIILEHFKGQLPFWIAPEQVRILSVGKNCGDYLAQVQQALSKIELQAPLERNRLRFEIDDRNESLSKKIADARLKKIPLLGIVGDKEVESRSISFRNADGKNQLVSIDNLQEYCRGKL